MKLNKKYCFLIDSDNGYDNQLLSDCCEKIADEFAIEFSVWTHNLRTDCEKGITELSKWENTSNKELLEIYKKEKGL
jgi:hypothetical protein